jgi:phosphoribosylamine--glycine ligase
VLEFNCRFGDPETQAVLPRLRSDLLTLLTRSVEPGGLRDVELQWSDNWAVTVVLASRGYPAGASKGDGIEGLERFARGDSGFEPGEVEVTHAGTARGNGALVTDGGRVLNVTGLGPAAESARARAYAAVEQIRFEGVQYRGDIAAGVAAEVPG